MSEAPEIPEIVVVDDDPEILKLITMLLRRIGADTKTFLHGRKALDYLANEIPDLIILDLMMPEVNGFEVLRDVRNQTRLSQVPVLILSAKTDAGSIRQGLEQGADGYVTKPYIANTLIDRVRLLLDSERQVKPQDSPGTD